MNFFINLFYEVCFRVQFNIYTETSCIMQGVFFISLFKIKFNYMKNHFLLKALFGAFFVLKLAGVEPFGSWSWWLIFGVLVLHYVRLWIVKIWRDLGLDKLLAFKIAEMRYDMLLKSNVNRFKKDLKNGK